MENLEIKKSYYAIIPADVRYSDKIVDGAKLLYGEITCLCNEKGFCWANNNYFSKLYGNTKVTISRWFSSLEKEGFIYIDNTDGKRKIFLCQKLNTPGDEVKEIKTPKKKEKKIIKKEIKKIKKYTDNDLELAELLLSKIIYNFPLFENKKVKISDWAEDIRKLREIDKATEDQIRFMIIWVQGGDIKLKEKIKTFEQHEFWAKNIMSASKLRKQWFDHLIPQMQASLFNKKAQVTQLQLYQNNLYNILIE